MSLQWWAGVSRRALVAIIYRLGSTKSRIFTLTLTFFYNTQLQSHDLNYYTQRRESTWFPKTWEGVLTAPQRNLRMSGSMGHVCFYLELATWSVINKCIETLKASYHSFWNLPFEYSMTLISSTTIPKSVITIHPDSESSLNLEWQKSHSSPTLNRHAQGHDTLQFNDNTHPLSPTSSSQSSLQTISDTSRMIIGKASPRFRFPPSPSLSAETSNNCNQSVRDVPEFIITNDEPFLSAAQFSSTKPKPQEHNLPPPPLTNNNPFPSRNLFSSALPKHYSFNLKNLKALNPALVLQNSGSVARDHLASERTYLAYVRTSLGLTVAGVGIVQLFTITDFTSTEASAIPLLEANRRVHKLAMALGIMILIFALYMLFMGEYFYPPFSTRLQKWKVESLGLISAFFVLLFLFVYDEVNRKIPQGVYRYFVIQHALPKNMFPVARFSIIFISIIFGVFIAVVFGLLNERMGILW